ncbi:uncharacterized protein Dwil_GK15519 [Drosophila willistoni]|uniref:C2H2-type domain-containing protein n=1 Tax=Drosophila willistoni TaxID=7260 RepID=B4MWQ6_DROWI|nr:uncharacterized protein LOC6642412 isoform X2 [Drosophila willistoni]EDW76545.2 uncharacterized protein Dwil_GK15519 [Drosophila willistoni]
MLSRKYPSSCIRRLPPVHEQIALQCAKNISRMAVDLPKPTIPTGEVPVLVELRRTDDSSVHYYQVNVSSDYHNDDIDYDRDEDWTTVIGEISNLKQWLNLTAPITETADIQPPPCPMHGQLQQQRSVGTIGSIRLAQATNPQVMMTQSALHIVQDPETKVICKENVATFNELPITREADELTKEHFMATLHQQQASPLDYAELWLPQHGTCWAIQRFTPLPLEIAEISLDENNEYVKKVMLPTPAPSHTLKASPQLIQQAPQLQNFPLKIQVGQQHSSSPIRLLNGIKLNDKISVKNAVLRLNQNGDYVSSEQVLPRINGFKYSQHHQPTHGPNGYSKPQKSSNGVIPTKNGFKLAMESIDIHKHHNGEKGSFRCLDMTPPTGTSSRSPHYHQVPLLSCYNDDHLPKIKEESNLHQDRDSSFTKKVTTLHMHDMLAPEATYPVELQTLFRWNYCDLCRTAMRTVRNAVDHYSSKAHDRRVNTWLMRHCCEYGNASEEVLRCVRTPGPAAFYCEVCDLKLTSMMHAQQHLFGRRHLMVSQNMTKPNGEGHYDDQGRWVRTDTKWLMCQLCDVSITSESQMAMHMAGARHRRRQYTSCPGVRLSLNGSHIYRITANGSMEPLNPFGCYMKHSGNCSGIGSALNGIKRLPLGILRGNPLKIKAETGHCQKEQQPQPNGTNSTVYYCEVCNINLNHLKSAKQHEDGRMHNKKMQRVNIFHAAYA